MYDSVLYNLQLAERKSTILDQLHLKPHELNEPNELNKPGYCPDIANSRPPAIPRMAGEHWDELMPSCTNW